MLMFRGTLLSTATRLWNDFQFMFPLPSKIPNSSNHPLPFQKLFSFLLVRLNHDSVFNPYSKVYFVQHLMNYT